MLFSVSSVMLSCRFVFLLVGGNRHYREVAGWSRIGLADTIVLSSIQDVQSCCSILRAFDLSMVPSRSYLKLGQRQWLQHKMRMLFRFLGKG